MKPEAVGAIFLTVGTQEPFDRLVQAVDEWVARNPQHRVFGQLGALKSTSYRPQHFEWRDFIDADTYQAYLENCPLLIAHAGMGSIISALTWGKPLVMMARRASLGEHRNEHQLATAAKFQHRAGVTVAADEQALAGALDAVMQAEGRGGEAGGLSPFASDQLIATLRDFIHQN